jgi:hypothetical protein
MVYNKTGSSSVRYNENCVGYDVTAAAMNSTVVTRRFGGTYRLHLQD